MQIGLIEKFNKEDFLNIEKLMSYLGLLLVDSKDANEEIKRLIDLKNNNVLDKLLDNIRHQKQLVLKIRIYKMVNMKMKKKQRYK